VFYLHAVDDQRIPVVEIRLFLEESVIVELASLFNVFPSRKSKHT
jgi:hypothetical protein